MSAAVQGLALARTYFVELVSPVLRQEFPNLGYAAAHLGTGSDVLGLDDEMSRDHDWGLRLQLFVGERDVDRVSVTLDQQLPQRFRGFPIRFGMSGDPTERVRIDVSTLDRFAQEDLGFDPRRDPSPYDWLSLTGQAALEVTAGEVFRDDAGDLTALREALVWWPDDLWRYLVACDWQRLDQELPLMQRAGDRGDDLGSRVIAGRLVDVAMHLGFLLCRQWAPYSKWRGTLFTRLPLDPAIGTALGQALRADDWHARGAHLASALEALATHQRRIGLPSATPVAVPFWDRPYFHVDPHLVPELLDSIDDPLVRDLPPGLGSIEQRTDNVDVLMHPARRRAALG